MTKDIPSKPVAEPPARSVTGELVPKHSSGRPIHPIEAVLDRFLAAVDDYREVVFTTLPVMAEKQIEGLEKLDLKLKKFVKETREDGAQLLHAKEAHEIRDLVDALREQERLMKSRTLPLMARSFFIGLFSEYDSFIGGLLKAIYCLKPDLYRGIKREISVTELFGFQTLDDVKKDMLEQEIDAFRRGSYIEQFSELERKFDIKTLRTFKEWPQFVESAQRRNLMTHNDGCVSQQYINVCQREGVSFDKYPEIGAELKLEPKYLIDAIMVVSKVGFMLTHTLWRKLFPEEIDEANRVMNNAIFNLLTRKRWRAAAEFGEFAMGSAMTNKIRDMDKMIRVINTAIALKRMKQPQASIQLIDSVDWSASIREFKLANAVLRNDYSGAAKLMIDIGKKGELLDELAYHQWPLFDEFRSHAEFKKAYETIYGIKFRAKPTKHEQENDAGSSVKEKSPKRAIGRVQRGVATQKEFVAEEPSATPAKKTATKKT